jgi:hypothetical protein
VSTRPRLRHGGVGTTRHRRGKFLGRRTEMDITCTECEPSNKFTFEMTGPLQATMTFTFDPGANGTRVFQVVDGEPGGFFRLVGPLFVSAAKRQSKIDLDNLRDLMEADALGD